MPTNERVNQPNLQGGYRPDDAAFYARRMVDTTSAPRTRSMSDIAAQSAGRTVTKTVVTESIVSATVSVLSTPVQAPTPMARTPQTASTPTIQQGAPATTPAASPQSVHPATNEPAFNWEVVEQVRRTEKTVVTPVRPVAPSANSYAQTGTSQRPQSFEFIPRPQQAVKPLPVATPTASTFAPAPIVASPVAAGRPVQPGATTVVSSVESRTVSFETVLAKSVEKKREKVDKSEAKKTRRKGFIRYGLAGVGAMVILALTGYVSLETWTTTSAVKEAAAESRSTNTSGLTMGEGEDETEVTKSAVDSYSVAPDMPRVVSIDKINVRARVLPMSVNANGNMQAPVNVFDSGWYGASAKPGEPGAAIINGHASGATREGLFAYLDTLVKGDTLSVERGDGQKFTYKVVHTEKVALDSVDMKRFMRTYQGVKEGVNLMTCTGKWLPEKNTYDHRVMVYTERVK